MRTALAPLVHRSWLSPMGTFKFAAVPFMVTIPSPKGFSIVHSRSIQRRLIQVIGHHPATRFTAQGIAGRSNSALRQATRRRDCLDRARGDREWLRVDTGGRSGCCSVGCVIDGRAGCAVSDRNTQRRRKCRAARRADAWRGRNAALLGCTTRKPLRSEQNRWQSPKPGWWSMH